MKSVYSSVQYTTVYIAENEKKKKKKKEKYNRCTCNVNRITIRGPNK
jgi:hypothetical protein